MDIEVITLQDGSKRKLRVWTRTSEVRQVVVVSHGMAEHIERYGDFARILGEAGVLVCGINHRGHGPDAEHLGHFADRHGWYKVLSDLDSVIEYVSDKYSMKPVLVGHSMGSFVARHYAVLHGKKLSGLVLCGSNHQSSMMFHLGLLAAKFEKWRIGANSPSPLLEKLSFSNSNARIKPLRTEQDWLSRDPLVVDGYIADKYCGFTCTPQFWIDFLQGLVAITKHKSFSAIPSTLPILVIAGDADPVTRYGKGSALLAKTLKQRGGELVKYIEYQDARHELFNEINRAQVLGDLTHWLNSLKGDELSQIEMTKAISTK